MLSIVFYVSTTIKGDLEVIRALDLFFGWKRRERKSPVKSPTILCFYVFHSPDLAANMTTSRRLADRKVDRFEKNINKRGSVPETTVKKGSDYPVGPVLLGFFVFVVIGSSLFQIIRTATTGGMA